MSSQGPDDKQIVYDNNSTLTVYNTSNRNFDWTNITIYSQHESKYSFECNSNKIKWYLSTPVGKICVFYFKIYLSHDICKIETIP